MAKQKDYPYQWHGDAWAAFYRALLDGDVGELNVAFDAGLAPDDESGPEGRPIMQIANMGSNELLKCLLEKGAQTNYDTNGYATPLHAAASHGYTETVKLLLAHGADPNAKTQNGLRGESFYCPFRGETPLHLAAAYGDLELINALVEAGADKTVNDATGPSALDYYRRHRGEKRDDTGLRETIRGWFN